MRRVRGHLNPGIGGSGFILWEKGNSAMLNLQKVKIDYTMDQLSKAYSATTAI
jgi:hypothetical protein